MAVISIDSAVDLTAHTLAKYDRHKWTDLMSDIRRFHAVPQILKKKKVTEESGDYVKWQLLTDDNDSARHTGLFSVDQTSAPDTHVMATAPWRHTEASCTWDLLELKICRAKQALLNLLRKRHVEMRQSLAALIESVVWSVGPTAGPTDETTPWGMFMYLVRKVTGASAQTGAGEFGGTAPTNWTTVAGVNPSTQANGRWCNWTHKYTTVSRSDLIYKMRKGAEFTNFESAVAQPLNRRGDTDRVYYTLWDVAAEFASYAEDRNDNLGKDLAVMDGKATFHGNPIRVVPQLENDATHATQKPVLQVDWSVFSPVLLAGDNMVETTEKGGSKQHRVVNHWVDLTWAMKCTDRRRLAYFSI